MPISMHVWEIELKKDGFVSFSAAARLPSGELTFAGFRRNHKTSTIPVVLLYALDVLGNVIALMANSAQK